NEVSKLVAKEMVAQLKKVPKLKDVTIDSWAGETSRSLRVRFLNKSKVPPRIKVLVQTSQVKGAGADDMLVLVRLNITEDAVEWTMVEIEGEETERLIPE
ncbi:hypothetical protein MYX75_02275, partial [Acidobacteria bacterium AH-259-A15]|nr:hypothetical protein [Acidobacteria bacterium AH-259-A15]